MSALWISLAAVAYLMIGGGLGHGFYKWRLRTCHDCHTFPYSTMPEVTNCYDFHGGPATVVGALWPLALPVLAGIGVAELVSNRGTRADRREKQKQADHERKMAELEAQREMTIESVKFLVENGIQADVPGLFDANGSKP